MSHFSISSNHYLRIVYSGNQELATTTGRENETSQNKLTSADATALRKGLKVLGSFRYNVIDDSGFGVKEEYYGKLKAFSDAYNNTIQSASRSQNKAIGKLGEKIKKLSSSQAKKLEKLGITFDSSGYMSVKKGAVENISLKNFENVLGKGSKYAGELDSLARKITNHIDVAV